ncbi:MAG TPA: glucokinase [Gammaproteobacteria bacterium]|nr:glucokinase [Gammaproteobacteria bacterium]
MNNLIGDIGGTNTRLALAAAGEPRWDRLETYRNDDYESLAAVIEEYLGADGSACEAAALAVAGPVRRGVAKLTNRDWTISASTLRERFRWKHCTVVNDFSAVALAIPALRATDLEQTGGGERDAEEPVAILGPGTGLGVAGLIPGADGGRVLVTEGGHATATAIGERSAAICDRLRRRFGHVSIERIVSGQGMENIYRAIGELDGKNVEARSAAEIGEAAMQGDDPVAAETMEQFFALLGAAAGNLALTYGAFGGVYIAGGIVPRYLPLFRCSRFRESFEAKGRLSGYVRAIPAFVILHEEVELLGLAASLAARGAGRAWPRV